MPPLFACYSLLAAVAFHCCARIFSSCGEQGRSSWDVPVSLRWLLLSWSAGSRLEGFGSFGARA